MKNTGIEPKERVRFVSFDRKGREVSVSVPDDEPGEVPGEEESVTK